MTKSHILNKMDETNPNMIELKNLYNQLHQIENKWLSGVIIRSREEIVLNQEKPTKLFFAQEKIQQEKKNITTINTGDTTHTDPQQIMQYLHDFYFTLYQKHETNEDTEKK